MVLLAVNYTIILQRFSATKRDTASLRHNRNKLHMHMDGKVNFTISYVYYSNKACTSLKILST